MKLSDKELNELLARARAGDKSAEDRLLNDYRTLVKSCARSYFLAGGDVEDLIQVGMIGLWSAIRDYDGSKSASFYTFAQLCVNRRIISAVKKAGRQKNKPLNDAAPIDDETEDGAEGALPDNDPLTALLEKERVGARQKKIEDKLTALEKQTLFLYLDGLSYGEIAGGLNKDEKSVDNTLTRIKKKLREDKSGT
ncbi:MAG: sigma-70 family RNA polymerase sigma factor [Clostridiales bacterium]|jgi:RNA polymerase sporulation-specific sigma factor|nr:sigma-70 family RNA polymerase sigma factor [Clostridiales bacterium]